MCTNRFTGKAVELHAETQHFWIDFTLENWYNYLIIFKSSGFKLKHKGRQIMDEILEILENDARITPEEIAKMVKTTVAKVKQAIKKYEKDGIILKYRTIINKELVKEDGKGVRALIEVNVLPQKNVGFDSLAERIYSFPEVTSCYLVSGTYDLLLIVEGRDIQTVSSFVSAKLAPMANVRGTITHFLLKKYKDDSVILKAPQKDKRLAITY